jgi:hypothetical protein
VKQLKTPISGVWCEDIVLGSERQLLRHQNEDDHLIIAFDQSGAQAGFPNLLCELFIFLNFEVVEKLLFCGQIIYLKTIAFR